MKTIASSSLALVLLLSACGSDESGSSSTDVAVVAQPGAADTADSSSDASAPTATEPETTTTSTTLVPARTTLAGVWRAPAEDILSANLANLGGLPMNCVGEIVMNLDADGSFSRGGTMACSIDGMQMSGQVMNSSGTWDATSSTLTVTVTESDGYAEATGPDGRVTRVPLPDSGFSSVAYTVNATTLTITFTDPSVGTVTQVYTRG